MRSYNRSVALGTMGSCRGPEKIMRTKIIQSDRTTRTEKQKLIATFRKLHNVDVGFLAS
jgi:hypothetical protein